MDVPIFLAYIDDCIENHKQPTIKELLEWKKDYNHR